MVSRDIRRILTERARFFNLVLDDVSITHLTFSKQYEAAVEAKQVGWLVVCARARAIAHVCFASPPSSRRLLWRLNGFVTNRTKPCRQSVNAGQEQPAFKQLIPSLHCFE